MHKLRMQKHHFDDSRHIQHQKRPQDSEQNDTRVELEIDGAACHILTCLHFEVTLPEHGYS